MEMKIKPSGKDAGIDAYYFNMVNTYGDLDLMIESFNSNG